MSWSRKEHTTYFDTIPIEGLYFLDGDRVADVTNFPHTRGQKYPLVEFPSGESFTIRESRQSDEKGGLIHLFGEMELSYRQTRDQAYEAAHEIAEQVGYQIKKVDETILELHGLDRDEHIRLVFDNEQGVIQDAMQIEPDRNVIHPAHVYMTEELREQLPDLYENEELGKQAPVLVKYFTPDSNWTWYATEFDGEDVFFGLVAGFEVELGYFSLSELHQIRGPLGLAVERDLHFTPKTLQELIDEHTRSEDE